MWILSKSSACTQHSPCTVRHYKPLGLACDPSDIEDFCALPLLPTLSKFSVYLQPILSLLRNTKVSPGHTLCFRMHCSNVSVKAGVRCRRIQLPLRHTPTRS